MLPEVEIVTVTYEDSQNEAPWHLTEVNFRREPDGQLVRINRKTVFDDGVVKTERMSGNVPIETVFADNPELASGNGARSWQTITVRYDVSPDASSSSLSSVERINDDGTEQRTKFESGVLREVIQLDNPQDPDDPGVKPWTSIRTLYDDSGKRELVLKEFDNGISEVRTYDSGELREIERRDTASGPDGNGNFSWQFTRSTFDAEGRIASSFLLNDDGTLHTTTYEAGVKREIVQLDNTLLNAEDETPLPGAKPWTSIRTEFDQSGQISSRFFVFDDGRQRLDAFVDGTIRQRTETDSHEAAGQAPSLNGSSSEVPTYPVPGGSKPWDVITTDFNSDGHITFRQIQYDNGVIQTDLHEEYPRLPDLNGSTFSPTEDDRPIVLRHRSFVDNDDAGPVLNPGTAPVLIGTAPVPNPVPTPVLIGTAPVLNPGFSTIAQGSTTQPTLSLGPSTFDVAYPTDNVHPWQRREVCFDEGGKTEKLLFSSTTNRRAK